MGNSMWCSASGEHLASAARDGDVEEARTLLDLNPGLATYSTFAAQNSPLHFAASRGHAEIVSLLLENGADASSRNVSGQTALMLACRRGHWEVVLALLVFRSSVTRAEYLSGKTALHYAASGGHIRCIRLLATDFVPSTLYGAPVASIGSFKESCRISTPPDSALDINALSRFVNKVADGGVTALHLAASNGHSECLELLLDLRANVSAVTYPYGSSMKMIGAGSTPLHFAASGGNLKCCEAKSFLPEVLVG